MTPMEFTFTAFPAPDCCRTPHSVSHRPQPSDRTKPDVLDCFARTLSICMYRNKLEVGRLLAVFVAPGADETC